MKLNFGRYHLSSVFSISCRSSPTTTEGGEREKEERGREGREEGRRGREERGKEEREREGGGEREIESQPPFCTCI